MTKSEIVEAIHGEGGLAGIHICANTDWSLALDGSLDMVFPENRHVYVSNKTINDKFVSCGGDI